MKKFEILQELSKCDTDRGSKQMLLEKNQNWEICYRQGCHKPLIPTKIHCLWSAIKQSSVKGGVPVYLQTWSFP